MAAVSPPPRLRWRGLLALAELRFVRGRRKRHRHLRRLAGAAVLALITGTVLLQAAAATSSSQYGMLTAQAYAFIGVPLLLYATLVSLSAGGDFAGPERERALGLTLLTPIRAVDVVLAAWGSLVAEVMAGCLIVLPFLAGLTLVGRLEASTILAYVTAVVCSVMVVIALGLAVSIGASSAQAGSGRTLIAAFLLYGGGSALAAEYPSAAGAFLGPTGFFLLAGQPFAGPSTPGLGRDAALSTLAMIAVFLLIATSRVRRRFQSTPGAGAKTRADRKATARRPIAAGETPLLELDAAYRRRRAKAWQLGWVIVILGIAVMRLWDRRRFGVLFDPEFFYIVTAILGATTACYALAGSLMWWQRLRAKELLPLVLATPLPPSSYIAAALQASLRLAWPPLLAMAIASGLARATSDLGFGGWPLAAALIALSLIVLTLAGLMMGVVVPERFTRRTPPEFAVLLCLAPFLAASIVALFDVGKFHAFMAIFVLPLLAMVGARIFRHRDHTRVIVAKPALLVGVGFPLLVTLAGMTFGQDSGWWYGLSMIANPALVFGMSVLELCSDELRHERDLQTFAGLALFLLAAEIRFFLRWIEQRFDLVFGRIA